MTTSLGLDLSLTGSGVALLALASSPSATRGVVETVESAPERKRKKGDPPPTLLERRARLRGCLDRLRVLAGRPTLAVLEQPAYAAAGGSTHDRAGLWWQIVEGLLAAEVPVVEVTPQQVKIYATGTAKSDKDAVLAAVVRRYPTIEVTNNNEADALVLAAMGARWLGCPVEASLPQTHLRAMDTVRWPET